MNNGHQRWLGTTTLVAIVTGIALLVAAAACSSRVDEAASGTVVGMVDQKELAAGKSVTHTFDLSPGTYALMCNIPGHYQDGMHTAFRVTDGDGSRAPTVRVELGEWFVRADSGSQAAGPLTFQVTNKGGQEHNLVLIKTDLEPHALVVR